MKPETAKYINRIKNPGKRNYAQFLWHWIHNITPKHPNYKDFGISCMAAQAVEINLGRLENYYKVLDANRGSL